MAVRVFRLVRLLKRGLQATGAMIWSLLAPLGQALVRFIILPFYRAILTVRLRIQRLAIPARGAVLFLITNRYLYHVVIVIVAAATLSSNILGRQAHAQDIGQKSLLFALTTNEQVDIIEEQVRPEQHIKETKYLGDATIESVPHVDFDYDVNLDPVAPSLTVPGAIAVQPYDIAAGAGSSAPRTKTETYVVKEGDTIGSIANQFGINVGSILWNNNLTEKQYIRPGDALRIPQVSGILATVKTGDTVQKLAQRYGADADEILNANKLADARLSAGNELIIPGGKPPAPAQIIVRNTPAQTGKGNGLNPPASVNNLLRPNASKPPDANIGTLAATRLLWPTPGHVITQYYGWKHTGVDIDGDYSSPLYAAADGVVETAGWNSGGYGLQIVIDHPNGVKTRYAHSSKLFVKVGDQVKRGQTIAMMGTTGRSTGTHLHFEVYVNGIRTNPLGYIR